MSWFPQLPVGGSSLVWAPQHNAAGCGCLQPCKHQALAPLSGRHMNQSVHAFFPAELFHDLWTGERAAEARARQAAGDTSGDAPANPRQDGAGRGDGTRNNQPDASDNQQNSEQQNEGAGAITEINERPASQQANRGATRSSPTSGGHDQATRTSATGLYEVVHQLDITGPYGMPTSERNTTVVVATCATIHEANKTVLREVCDHYGAIAFARRLPGLYNANGMRVDWIRKNGGGSIHDPREPNYWKMEDDGSLKIHLVENSSYSYTVKAEVFVRKQTVARAIAT